ncbi:MAG: SPOR domain-containing protein [Rhizobiales bacterium]|nr:SPOR domain-containing protein [Hyphomicrobiales bacterium]
MANKVQLRAAGDQDFKANDPFAELTRIMGFDPRVQPTPRPDENFEIDLEKELMGMFDPGPDAPIGPSQPDYPQENAGGAPAVDEVDEAFAASLEEELAGDEDFWRPAGESDAGPVTHEDAGAADEGLADVDMDFGVAPPNDAAPEWTGEVAPAWTGEVETTAQHAAPERAEAQPAAAWQDERNVYRPSFSAPGYASHPATEETPRHYGAVEAPVFDIRSFKSAAQQYREAAPKPEAPAAMQGRAEAPAEERPAARARAIDPFDILAALGTDRGLPQRRDPMKPMKAETPAPAVPEADHHAMDEDARDDGMSVDAHAEEPAWPSYAVEPEAAAAAVTEEYVPVEDRSEITPFLDIRAADEPAQHSYIAADIERMADAMHAYMAPVPDVAEPAEAEAAREIGTPEIETPEIETPEIETASAIDTVRETETMSGIETAREAETTPEIETMEVFEPAVAVADDLDIPVPTFLTEERPAPVYDELDEEFEHAFQTLSQHTEAIRQAAVAEEWVRPAPAATDIERLFAEELGIASRHEAPVAPAAPAAVEDFAAAGRHGAGVEAGAEDELVFDDADFLPDEFAAAVAEEPDEAYAPAAYAPRRIPARRGRLLAGVAVGVLLIGGIGAFALSRGSSEKSDQPVVLKADAHPVKVKPKNPGGVNVPNQDNKVYERVADGATATAPEQKKLVSTEEQPVDISARAKDNSALPGVFEDDQSGPANGDASAGGDMNDAAAPASDGGKASANAAAAAPAVGKTATSQDIADLIKAAPKGEHRLAPTPDPTPKLADGDILAVTPRKVKTMIVRADGTMVPREDPAPAESKPAAAPQAKDAPAQLPAAAPVPTQEPAASKEDAMAAMAKADVKPAEAQKPEQPAPKSFERTDRGRITMPARVAVAPSRPADQPVDIVGAAPQKVASAEPAPAPAPVKEASGDWSMQIASQPTAEAAQTSYQNLARRYSGILGGHAANIVKAEITGKGTYYRVRISAGSKEDAIALCTKYKAAGGTCFVSK